MPDAGDMVKRCVGSQACDGLAVRDCRNGVLGDNTITSCQEEGACSQGRCMTTACAAADAVRNSIEGCVFYTVEVDNAASDAAALTSFLVSNPGFESATVTLEQLEGDGNWMMKQQATVAGAGAARLTVSGPGVVPSGVSPAGGLRLTSTRPVTVAQIESDDSDEHAQSSGGTMLLPTHVLGSHYFAMAYPQGATGTAVSAFGAPDGAGRLLIVGTQPRTNVTLKPSLFAPMTVTGMDPAEQYSFVLGDGDVFQAWTGADLEDLSGTEIIADQPVAVFSGNIVTNYGRPTTDGIHSPDMAYEQIPPIASWSFQYVAAALPPQASTCDSLLGQAGRSVWRFLGNDAMTYVDFSVPSGTPPGPLALMPGEAEEIVVAGDFFVSSSGPLLVTQGIDCEPSLSLAVSVDQMLDDVTFAVLPYFDQAIAVVRKHGDQVMLDDTAIPQSLFSPAGGLYEVAHLQLPSCPASQRVCPHRLHGKFGMTMRGMDVLASYALTVPAWSGCHDSIDSTCIQ
jgi:hypothetical protein